LRDRRPSEHDNLALRRRCASRSADDMLIGRNEIGVQHMIRVFAQKLGVAL
jgi:hypothetical protein